MRRNVRDVMTTRVVSVLPDAPVSRAVDLMRRYGFSALPGLAEELGTDEEVAEQLRTEYARRLQILSATDRAEPAAEDAVSREKQHVDLRLALLGRKHDTIVRLWDRNEIDDSVLQHVQAVFDLERVSVEKHRDII